MSDLNIALCEACKASVIPVITERGREFAVDSEPIVGGKFGAAPAVAKPATTGLRAAAQVRLRPEALRRAQGLRGVLIPPPGGVVMATFRVGDTPPQFDGQVDILDFAAGIAVHDHDPCPGCIEQGHQIAALEAEISRLQAAPKRGGRR